MLTVVGTGFMVAGQVTAESVAAIRDADRVLFLVADAATRLWLQGLNPSAQSLYDAYAEGRHRLESYREMVERILAPVRTGLRVCAVFYGHPGVFVNPSHEAVRQARAEGFEACMLPGVSAEDCLFAELEIDPTRHGCRSYEATDFLLRRRPLEPTTGLALWQVGAIGIATFYRREVWRTEGLYPLVETLLERYSPDHGVVLYTAATLPIGDSTVIRLPLARLPEAEVSVAATLYVPPAAAAPVDPEVAARLGLAEVAEAAP